MKKHTLAFFVLLSLLCRGQMVNPGFEQTAAGAYTSATAASGWTVESRTANSTCTFTNWIGGSSEFSIVSTPFNNYPFTGCPLGIIGQSPLGGSVVARLNDSIPDYQMTRIRQSFTVTSASALLQYAFAGYWQDGGSGHLCCDQSGIDTRIYDQSGNPLYCYIQNIFPGNSCQSAGVTFTTHGSAGIWSNWQVRAVDLSPYIGQQVTVEFITTDCSFGTHFGSSLLDVTTSNKLLFTPVALSWMPYPAIPPTCTIAFCPGSNYAYLNAPTGYANYQWYGPSGTIAAPQGTQSTLVLSSPSVGTIYTVTLQHFMGCMSSITYTVSNSQVSIWDLNSSGTCPGVSNGAATVIPVGSTGAYNFQWVNSSNSVIATSSVVTGLSAGIYSLTVSGSAGCGTAVTTVTIGYKSPTLTVLPQAYCGNNAFLSAPTGTNYRWYNLVTALTNSTSATITVTNACNGCKYRVAFEKANGCTDSIEYVLLQVPPGSMIIPSASISPCCLGSSSGSVTIQITPAYNSSQTNYSFSVTSTGTTSAYSASVTNLLINKFSPTGLSAGEYIVSGSDGFCSYTNSFLITPFYPVIYSLTATGSTLCPGSKLTASVSFYWPLYLNQYSIQWTPGTWIQGSKSSVTASISPPPMPTNSISTVIYTVIVSPTIANCPVEHTLAITAATPVMPTISPIPAFCSNAFPFTVSAIPAGGTFSSSPLAPSLVLPNGKIQPGYAAQGNNTIYYSLSYIGCSSTDSIHFTVSKFYEANLYPQILSKCVSNEKINLGLFVPYNKSGTWTGKDVVNGEIDLSNFLTGNYPFIYHTYSLPDSSLCPDADTLSLTVHPLPTVSLPSGQTCTGKKFILTPSGASSYTYFPSGPVVTPTAHSTYSVWGSKNGCVSNAPAIATVSVFSYPIVNAISNLDTVCAGEYIILKAVGAQSYQWIGGPATSTFTTQVWFDTIFEVEGWTNGCMVKQHVIQEVNDCVPVEENGKNILKIFPNPAQESVSISLSGDIGLRCVELVNSIGEIQLKNEWSGTEKVLWLANFPAGLYFIILRSSSGILVRQKLLIE